MKKIKLLTFFTDSHVPLYEKYFVPSYNTYLKDDFELYESHYEQVCEKASYGTPGFGETMIGKLNHIIDYIDLNDENPLVFADCDIQFFNNFKDDIINELDDYDIKFQDDILVVCAGFFICKQNQKILNFFNDIRKTLVDTVKNGMDDQQLINLFLRTNKHPLKHGVLSRDKYFTVASANGGKQWNGSDFNIPKTILVHHGNWTVGLENKFKLLEYVKNNR